MRNFLKVSEDVNDKFNFWRVRHNQAVISPKGVEVAIVSMFEGLEAYKQAHEARFESKIEDDYVLVEGIIDIAKGLRVLLNGELGRLDAGTLDKCLVDTLTACGELV